MNPTRFWAKVDRSGACWEWRGGHNSRGYGMFRIFGKQKRAHRLAWEFTHGPIPAAMLVLHRCDNPPCCNPEHLFLGTNDDNVRDKVAKSRQARGDRFPQAKLTEEDVVNIRGLANVGVTQRAIAKDKHVSRSLIEQVVNRKIWRHVG